MTELSAQDLLSTEREATIARIDALTAEFDDIVTGSAEANSDDEHDPEGSTLAFERARVSTLIGQGRVYLKEIERAQQRISDGTYGVCEHCGSAIPPDRLAARPATVTCVDCPSPSS
jgi:DnaK suppressor protein